MREKKNIAIFGGSALGDSIVVTPLLKNLKIEFPNSKIFYVTGNLIGIRQLKNCPYIDKLISISGFNLWKIIKTCFQLLNGRIKYTFTNYAILQTLFLSKFCLAKKNITVGSDTINKFNKYYQYLIKKTDNIVTQTKGFIEYISENPNISFDDSLEIFLRYQEQEQYIKDLIQEHNISDNKKIIVIHLGGQERGLINGRNPRCRDNDRRVKTIDFMIDNYDVNVFFIGGNDISEDTEYVISKIHNNKLINLVGKINIEQSTALIKKCDLFLCTDSGPMHVAAAFKKNVIALLSDITHKIDSYISNPIRKANVIDIGENEVIDEITKVFNNN